MVILPTMNTGLELTCLIACAYWCSQPASKCIGVWMKAWWTPAETLT